MAERRGTDRAGRRSKRFLSPLQKYEIWPQPVRQEVRPTEVGGRVSSMDTAFHRL
jgi:hypothetical protein